MGKGGGGSRVSGVLACYNFKPASIHAARMQLFAKLKATHPLSFNPFGSVLAAPADSLSDAPSTPLHEMLKLSLNWPGE